MHLVTNAIQAMPEGGTMTITTRSHPEGVAILVEDEGRGIPAEHLDRVFDPFFTTKDVWGSTGLGLAVCYSIVEAHGGSIELASEVGVGTEVTVILPLEGPGPVVQDSALEEPVGLVREHSSRGKA